METTLREITYQNWITIIIIGSFILLTIVKFFYGQRFSDFINIVGADRFFTTRSRGIYILHPFQLVLTIIQFIGISLFAYLIFCTILNLPFSKNFKIFGYIFLGYAAFEIFKFLVERFIGYVLNFHKKMQPFQYKRLNVKNHLGLFAILCSSIIIYQSAISLYFIYSAVAIIIAVYTISQIWLLSKYKDDFFRFPFYFILYFCTLEIGPYFILYSFITKQ